MTSISIIIPILNEEQSIAVLLKHLLKSSSSENISEILVIDGGSTDKSIRVVSTFSEKNKIIQLHSSQRGRAKQMNVGAKLAQGTILYFLHADSFPPKNFDKQIIKKTDKGHSAGCFKMKFDTGHLVLRISQWFTRFNWKICRGGDQSLFVKKEVFDQLKGFNERYVIYEDCEFINRLYNQHDFTVIQDSITTSSRRYSKNGFWNLQYHFTILHIKKRLGTSPEGLHQYYKKHIVS